MKVVLTGLEISARNVCLQAKQTEVGLLTRLLVTFETLVYAMIKSGESLSP